MAFDASGGRRGRGRGRSRGRGTLSEINVTPMVDVMLVLLIIFMVSAPLLSVGVPVDLPKTDAAALNEQNEPLTLTIRKDGSLFVQDQPAQIADVAERVEALTGADRHRPIYVRADGAAVYGVVAQVMAKLSGQGFSSINLVTDAGDDAPAAMTPALRP